MTLTKKSAEREYDKKLYSIALRYVRNHHDAEEIVQDTLLPDEIVISKERAMNLGRCIDSLSEKQRHIILLRYYYGLSEKEIADLMSMSESAVSSCVDRAKKSLREKIGGDYR